MKFGLVAGDLSETFAGAVRDVAPNVEFIRFWTDLDTMQRDLKNHGRELVKGLTGIMVLDYGLPSEDTDTEFARMLLIQNMFKSNDLYGVHLILYTLRVDLYDLLSVHFTESPDEKYDGLHTYVGGGISYSVGDIVGVLTRKYERLQRGAKEAGIRLDERKKLSQKILNTRKFYQLLGQREQIESQIRYLQMQLAALNQEFYKFTDESLRHDLGMMVQDYKEDIRVTENKEEVVMPAPKVEAPKKVAKKSFFGL